MTGVELLTADDGVRIAYGVRGDGTGGDGRPPVVLHHGFTVSAALQWVGTGVAPALEAAGRTVVLLDARGHGRSDTPHDPALYGEPRMARDLRLLVDHLGFDRYDLVGYSMGSIVSLLTAADDPRVRRVVVGGVGAGIVELGGVDTRALPPQRLVHALSTDDPASLTDPLEVAFRAMVDAVGADRRALAAHSQVVHQGPIALDRVTAPALVIAGADDPLAARPHVLADALPDARLVTLTGDHLSALADPAFTPTIVDFLAEP